MRLKNLIVCAAVIASTSAMAGFHNARTSQGSDATPQVFLDRNYGAYFAQQDWFKRIHLSAFVQGYAMWSKNKPFPTRFSTTKDKSTDFGLTRMDVTMDAHVNEWTHAHTTLSFHNKGNLTSAGSQGFYRLYDEASYRKYDRVDEATLVVADFKQSPAYLRGGIGYVPFGRYERHALPASLVTHLTQTQAVNAELGFKDMSGFDGSIYAFRSDPKNVTTSKNSTINNGGVSVGYAWHDNNQGFRFTADYMMNMAGAVNGLKFNSTVAAAAKNYERKVAGMALTASGHFMDFDGYVSYASAMKKFADNSQMAPGEKPSALHVEVGYSFPVMQYNTRVSASYQHSRQAHLKGSLLSDGTTVASTDAVSIASALPKSRFTAAWELEPWKNTTVGLVAVYDKPYKAANTAKPKSNLTGLFTVSARIA